MCGSGCGIGGDCRVDCYSHLTNSSVACIVPLIHQGMIASTVRCECQVHPNGIYYYKTNEEKLTTPCTTPAPTCLTGSNSPCNSHGDCHYNTTSNSFSCVCDTGYSGLNCSIAPICFTPTGQPCSGPNQVCIEGKICACKNNYQRTAERDCLIERCVSTGGISSADGLSCTCHNHTNMTSIPSLSSVEQDQTFLGCKKYCPISPSNGIECGVTGVCSDVVSGPIVANSVTPPPICACNAIGTDIRGNVNFFLFDLVTETCYPKCNPDGVCGDGNCPVTVSFSQYGTISNDLTTCACGPGFSTSSNCYSRTCSGKSHPASLLSPACICNDWCFAGTNCEIDLCASSGGVCLNGECDCSHSILLEPVYHNCSHKCKNGGIPSNDFTRCLCPNGTKGFLCEQKTNCIGCVCKNNGVMTSEGCDCVNGYSGLSCEVDVCSDESHSRIGGVCGCKPGYGPPSNCTTNTCGLNTILTSNGSCLCKNPGFVYSTDRCVAVNAPITPNCTSPFVLNTITDTCVCPRGTYGTNCSSTYCNSLSINKVDSLGRCFCKDPILKMASLSADSNGVYQCTDNVFYCNSFGTLNWSPTVLILPCVCTGHFTGTHCNSTTVTATDDSLPVISTFGIGTIVGSVVVIGFVLFTRSLIIKRFVTPRVEKQQFNINKNVKTKHVWTSIPVQYD